MAIDIDQSHYNTGTATVAGTAVTGQGTAWLGAVRAGDLFGTHKGSGVRIRSVNSNTSLTLAYAVTGLNQTAAAYEIQRTPYDLGYLAAIEVLINQYGDGILPALAALNGAGGDKGVMLTGAAGAATFALTAFARSLLDDANAAAVYGTLGQVPNAQIRNDLTPDKAFRRGNVLGTVSQSGGVPTGAIVERGSNASGEYIRFLDGSQFFVGNIELDLGTNVLQTFGIPASATGTYLAIVGGEVGSGTDIIRNAAGAANALVVGNELRVRISQPYSATFVRTIRYFSMNRWL